MRIRIVFQVVNHGGIVPFHHQGLLSDFIKSTLKRHPNPFTEESPYNFSALKGQNRVTRDGLFYESTKVTLVLSCLSKEFTDHFIEALFSLQQVYIGTLILKPLQVFKETATFSAGPTKFVCLSPLVIISEGLPAAEIKKFIYPQSEPFLDLLRESTLNRAERSGWFSPEEIASFSSLHFYPELEYLEKAKKSDKKYSRIYHTMDRGNEIEIRGYTFPFYLEAEPKLKEFIYLSGFGEETGEGYGMIDFAEKEGQTNIQPYGFSQTMGQVAG